MMKVAVADFDHFEMTYSLITCLSLKAKSIDLYSTAFIIALLKKSNLPAGTEINWIETASVAELEKNFQRDVAYDYIFLNTIDKHYSVANALLDSLKNRNIILTIHNINFWFRMRRRLKLFVEPRSEEHRMILQIAKKVSAYLVITEGLKKYLESDIKVEKKVLVFPYLISEPLLQNGPECSNGKLNIVIPGILKGGRKDYETALSVFRQLDKKRFALTLLGCAEDDYGKGILRSCECMKKEGFDVRWYDAYVLPDEFDRVMVNADIVLAPVQVRTRFGGVEEIYGQSKATGAEFDLIRYGKPGIFPTELQISNDLKNSVLTYASATELSEILNDLLHDHCLRHLHAHAKKVSRNYTPAIISRNLFNQLETLN